MVLIHDSETPAQGQQVITACAFIHQRFAGSEKLFWPRRAETKKFLPGKFELPGGHIEFGEDIITGLKRELLEEFQFEVVVGAAFYAFTYLNEVKGAHAVEVVFFAKLLTPDQQIQLNPADHSDYRWVSEAEFIQLSLDNQVIEDPETLAIQRGFAILSGTAKFNTV